MEKGRDWGGGNLPRGSRDEEGDSMGIAEKWAQPLSLWRDGAVVQVRRGGSAAQGSWWWLEPFPLGGDLW